MRTGDTNAMQMAGDCSSCGGGGPLRASSGERSSCRRRSSRWCYRSLEPTVPRTDKCRNHTAGNSPGDHQPEVHLDTTLFSISLAPYALGRSKMRWIWNLEKTVLV